MSGNGLTMMTMQSLKSGLKVGGTMKTKRNISFFPSACLRISFQKIPGIKVVSKDTEKTWGWGNKNK